MPRITRIVATEVVVPARPGAINSPDIHQPLHKLPVAGQAAWAVQFDALPKCVVELYLDDGIIRLGELYRDHDWRVVEVIAKRLLGSLVQLSAMPSPIVI
jgi:muconate cycloisomerase